MKYLFAAIMLFVSQTTFANQFSIKGRVVEILPCSWHHPIGREHDPLWECAAVETKKADGTVTNVEIIFPASIDIAWYKFPKLNKNEVGQFLVDDNSDYLSGHYLLVSKAL